jgi:hypothetical protein
LKSYGRLDPVFSFAVAFISSLSLFSSNFSSKILFEHSQKDSDF